MQRFGDGSRRALNVGYMGIYVVGHDQIHVAVFGNDVTRNILGEVIVDHFDPGIVDRGHDVRRRIDADHGTDTLVGQRAQQHAVIAAELQHRGLSGIEKPLRNFSGILRKMVAQGTD